MLEAKFAAHDEVLMTGASGKLHRTSIMYNTARRTLGHSLLVLAHALIWGLVELVALNRYRRPGR